MDVMHIVLQNSSWNEQNVNIYYFITVMKCSAERQLFSVLAISLLSFSHESDATDFQ